MAIRRETRGRRSVGGDSSLPCFLEQEWRCTTSILGSNDTPEGTAVGFVDLAKTLFINARYAHWVGNNATVETKWWVGSGVGESTARWRRFGEDSNRVAECASRAVGGGARKKGGS